MIHLLVKYQITSHSVNTSEIHPALSEIAKFISLSIVSHVMLLNSLDWTGTVIFGPINYSKANLKLKIIVKCFYH